MTLETRDRVLVEAEQLFAEHGFAGTRLASIATASGLGNAGLLHHFGSKAGVYRAVLDSIAVELDERTVVDAAARPGEQLQQIVDGLVSLHRDRPAALAIIAHEFLDRSGRIEGAETLPLAGIVTRTVAVIEAGQADGTIRQGDPVAMTAALHGALIVGAVGRGVYVRTSGTSSSDAADSGWDHELARSALAGVVADR